MRVIRGLDRTYFCPPDTKISVSILTGKEIQYGSFEKHTLALVKIPAGEKLDKHFHKEREESYFILSGRGKIIIDTQEIEVNVGDSVSIVPGEWHQLSADPEYDLEYMVITAPAWTVDDVHR